MKKTLQIILALIMVFTVTGCGSPKETAEDQLREVVYNEGKTYDEPKTYASGLITADKVILENAIFEKDLTIDASVLEGDVTLKNVSVGGKLIVNGGGKNSVHIEGSQIKDIVSDKKGSPVRIVTDKKSEVGSISVDGETLLEVNGAVNSISVNQAGAGSNIQLSAGSVVERVSINARVEISVDTPLKSLELNAKSTVTLNSAVDSVTLSKEANSTTLALGAQGVVDQMKTETTVEVTGSGKLNNVITDNQNNVTGDIKAVSVEIREKPLESATVTITPTATPEPTTTPSPRPKVTPTVKPSEVPTPAPTMVPTPTVAPVIPVVKTKEQLETAINDGVKSIQINGTIGSETDYTIYTIKHEMKIKGIEGAKVYGSFIVDADNVSIDGLEIHNQGWTTGNPTDARRNAISVVSNRVSITNNTLVASKNLNGSQTISNGIVIQAGTDANTSINVNGNTVKGYKYENKNWSSSGIIFVSNLSFPYNTTNVKGATKSVDLNVSFDIIAKANAYENCYNDFLVTDYSNGSNPYKYTYVSNTYGTIAGLFYANPNSGKIELAPGQYDFTKKETHTSENVNEFVVKENSELVIPSTAKVTIANDTELVVSVGGKLTGEVSGLVNDLGATPKIGNASLEYQEGAENIIIKFDLDIGFKLTMPSLASSAAVEAAYISLLMGSEIDAIEAASKLGNDVILCYYYLDETGAKIPLTTKGGNPLMKNKFWDGYLNYFEGTSTVRLSGGSVANTLIEAVLPKNKSWITSTNPLTDTVVVGWLDNALGKTVYVDIVIVYNGKIVKQTVSVELPNRSSVLTSLGTEAGQETIEKNISEDLEVMENIGTENIEPLTELNENAE